MATGAARSARPKTAVAIGCHCTGRTTQTQPEQVFEIESRAVETTHAPVLIDQSPSSKMVCLPDLSRPGRMTEWRLGFVVTPSARLRMNF